MPADAFMVARSTAKRVRGATGLLAFQALDFKSSSTMGSAHVGASVRTRRTPGTIGDVVFPTTFICGCAGAGGFPIMLSLAVEPLLASGSDNKNNIAGPFIIGSGALIC